MANSVLFSDSTFDDEDWQTEIIASGNGGRVMVKQRNTLDDATMNAVVIDNTGSSRKILFFREVKNTVYKATEGISSNIFGFYWRVGAIYYPHTQGAIAAIHYAEDAMLIQGFGEGQASGLALQQNQQIYRPAQRLITPEFRWTHKKLCNLHFWDFVAIEGGDRYPDFSATGAPIQFGFFRANTTTDKEYSITSAIANWVVAIDFIELSTPLPSR
jgi:hypothetical protein